MRVAEFSIYQQFGYNQQNSMQSLVRVNEQISSGLKIQYGYQDVDISINTLRLDQEEKLLKQTSSASQSGYDFALNSDKALNDMTMSLTSFKTKLVAATTETNSVTSREAIARELENLKSYMINIANTSINGRYLFSGSAMGVKPITNDGKYHGNDQQVKALVDSQVQYAYNVDGKSLFLGQDSDAQKLLTTNVPMKNQTLLHAFPPEELYLTEDNSIRDMTGNNGDGEYSYFYVSGKTSQGTSFKHIIQESIDSPISDLLSKIENEYSGTVEATLNEHGQIEIRDKVKGSSQLEFSIVGYDNTVPLSPPTEAVSGVNAGSTVVTMRDASGIVAGDVLNIGEIGQYTVASVSGNDVTFTLPLENSKDTLATDVDVRKVRPSSISTTVGVAGALINATSIPLTSAANILNGDIIDIAGIKYTVSSVNTATNTITIPSPGLSVALAGGEAVTNTTMPPPAVPSGVNGERITEFTKSGATIRNIGGTITGSVDYWNHTQFGFNVEMRRKDTNAIANSSDLLTDVIGSTPDSTNFSISLNGTSYTLALTTASTVGDFISQIQQKADTEFGQDEFQVVLDGSGKISIKDLMIDEDDASTHSSQLNSLSMSVLANTFGRSNGLETSKIYFDKEGSKLTGNASQVIKPTSTYHGNEYATNKTKLSEVAGLSSLSPLDTTTANSAIGATTISVTDGSLYKTGDMLTIGGNRYQIASVNNTTDVVTLSSALTTAVTSGDSFYSDKVIKMDIVDKNNNSKTVTLNLGSTMSTFQISGNANTYEVIDASNPQGHTTANNMTYKQLMDVISMATNSSLPNVSSTTAASASGTSSVTLASTASYSVGDTISIGNAGTYTISAIPNGTTLTLSANLTSAVAIGDEIMKTEDYNSTAQAAQNSVRVELDEKGRLTLEDMNSSSTNTKIMFTIYDSDVNSDFSTTRSIGAANNNALTFHSNSAVIIDDPHVDFFDQLQQAIDSVKSGKFRADSTNVFGERNTGMQGALTYIDHVLQHTVKKHTQIGATANAFQSSHDRAEALKLNVITVRSQFLDTDLAEASATLNQRMLSYQAMMSVLSKIKDLSLVKYL